MQMDRDSGGDTEVVLGDDKSMGDKGWIGGEGIISGKRDPGVIRCMISRPHQIGEGREGKVV